MTIAACYLTPEGVVLGADSTTSSAISPAPGQIGFHYFNHNQKLFELGEDSTLGMLTWGLGGLDAKSYRVLIASLADSLKENRPATLANAVERWIDQFWAEYESSSWVKRCRDLAAKPAPGAVAQPGGLAPRTLEEEADLNQSKANLVTGFCLAGYWLPDRTPRGYAMLFDPLGNRPTAVELAPGSASAWGAPALFKRLINGIDPGLRAELLASGHWNGTGGDFDNLVAKYGLGTAILPIRDAIDFVHTCIYCTIKAMKFSSLFQFCGGPIELAVITADRRFRWVRHKSWDSAVEEA